VVKRVHFLLLPLRIIIINIFYKVICHGNFTRQINNYSCLLENKGFKVTSYSPILGFCFMSCEHNDFRAVTSNKLATLKNKCLDLFRAKRSSYFFAVH